MLRVVEVSSFVNNVSLSTSLKEVSFLCKWKFTFNVCDCERKITWRSPLSQTSHTWIELGLKFSRKNGRKIDGITQLTFI